MHKSSLTPEIMRIICSEVLEPSDPNSRRLFSRLARTCRAFKDPALNALWSYLPSLKPLIQCLPSDLWWLDLDSGNLTFRRAMLPADWAIFKDYAARVRTLGAATNNTPVFTIFQGIDFEVISVLSCTLARKNALLPNLRELNWLSGSHSSHIFLQLFLPTHLKRLNVSFIFWGILSQSVIASVPTFSSFVTEFKCPKIPASSVSAVSKSIRQWYLLERVEIGMLDHLALDHLAILASLKRLTLHLPSVTKPDSKICLFGPSLPHLEVFARSMDDVRNWLRPMYFAPFLFTVTFDQPSGPPALLEFMMFISQRFSTDHLLNIWLLGSGLSIGSLRRDHLAPLFQFSKLRSLDLAGFNSSGLDDSDLWLIAQSWPDLLAIGLGDGVKNEAHQVPNTTLNGLVVLLKRCIHLQDLGLVFSTSLAGNMTLERPGGGVCNSNITTLSVGCSPITNPAAVAAYLSAILPSVTRIKSVANNTEWAHVEKLIPLFASARSQESSRSGIA
ncbi:hypothetical protein BJ138DRAFT_671320 [Hygrophoropsis aurantiaca]|uniref:Uncharacterized protein n=1 Tax=Hygrophoropsis aurantiaca TaxID=72124 RepID=A0ACB7ZZ00_9AGAM|nr:hypothetical protein BJ138DRAFT_671320 [Hygrophoropsis aurantiaca]